MNKLRMICLQTAGFYLLANIAVTSFAVQFDPMLLEEVKIELDGGVATIACSEQDIPKIEVRYEACKAIFDADYEREIASTYCKPLAVAQACSHKPLSH